MAEYIDREAAIAKMMLAYTLLQRDYLKKTIDAIPAADVAEVRRGHWWDRGSLSCRCSRCGCKNDRETRYCPHCGAEMDEEGNDG